LAGAPEGSFIRPAGLDFKEGDVGLTAGRRLTARDVGLAAAMNVPWLRVRRRPRIAILATGNELVEAGAPVGPNQIVCSNSPALAAFIVAHGGTPLDLGIARDTKGALQAAVKGARGADLLVTTGGVSVGEHDLVQSALEEVGLKVDLWKVAMRPGKPLMFGRLNGLPVLGFPGNPVSAVVCAIVYLGPAIEAMLGVAAREEPPVTAALGCDLAENDERQEYLRARLSCNGDGELLVTPFTRQDSTMLSHLAHADCLVVRPPFAKAAKAGTKVEVIRLRTPPDAT
jgi:molybdopterin molybdotransferase